MKIESVGVVIPACNEEQLIAQCLRSVMSALSYVNWLRRSWIVVVADSCVDGTEVIARQLLGDQGEVVSCSCRSPGATRAFGANALLNRFSTQDLQSLWLASTDADTVVPQDWIHKHLQLAQDDVSAVAGIVNVDSFQGHSPDAETRFTARYAIHADGTHPHVHGANMGVRADAFLDAGGWSNISVGEDHCLWRRVRNRGWRTRSASSSVVTTSGRPYGRARGGFADTLRAEGPTC